ncbi:MAG: hypothetical protein K0Q51_669 [Rickettsiaceae bacterium]|jgi:hypothetical protein|nr:hypothetical protein [Rickettsiaceae bacterium]
MDNTKENKEKDNIVQDKSSEKDIKPSKEIGGPKGLEPTRYGDWEKNGRVSDF